MTVQLRSLGSTPNSSERILEPALLRPLDPNYVTGLIDGEGSFNITLSKDDNLQQTTVSFARCYTAHSASVLYLLQEFVGCGIIKPELITN
jgi:hypothetical protein